jgi:hypothetical protein
MSDNSDGLKIASTNYYRTEHLLGSSREREDTSNASIYSEEEASENDMRVDAYVEQMKRKNSFIE